MIRIAAITVKGRIDNRPQLVARVANGGARGTHAVLRTLAAGDARAPLLGPELLPGDAVGAPPQLEGRLKCIVDLLLRIRLLQAG